MFNQINGVLRTILPAFVAYLVGRGYIATESADAVTGAMLDMVAALFTLGFAAWSYWSNRPVALVKQVAAMPGTDVVTNTVGNKVDIKVVDPELKQAAKEAATAPDGK